MLSYRNVGFVQYRTIFAILGDCSPCVAQTVLWWFCVNYVKIKNRRFLRWILVAGDGFIPLRSIGYGFLRVAQTGAFQSPNPCTEPPLLGGSNPTQHTLNKKYTIVVYFLFKLVAGDGFEPPTSRLWAWQATRLPYPAIWPFLGSVILNQPRGEVKND